MKLEELRIGNLVIIGKNIIKVISVGDVTGDYGDNVGINHNVESGYYGSFSIICEGYDEAFDNNRVILPIPITKENLIVMGFSFVNTPNAYGNDCNLIRDGKLMLRGCFSEPQSAWCSLDVLENGVHKPIKYIHKLQNFCYALTDKELIP